MKGDRSVQHDKPRLRLKVATRGTIRAVHGTDMAAEITGSRQQRMSDCQLANTADFLRLDEVHALEEEARGSEGWPQLVRAQARNFGFELLPLPSAAAGDSNWHRSIADVSREVGDAIAKIVQALADDGQVSASEIVEGGVIEEIDDGIAKLAVLKSLCLAELERPQSPPLRAVGGLR